MYQSPNRGRPPRHQINRSRNIQIGNGTNNIFTYKTVIGGLGSVGAAAVVIVVLVLFGSSIAAAAGDVWSNITTDDGNSSGPSGSGWAPNLPDLATEQAEVTISPTRGSKTGRIKVTGRHYEPGERISITVHTYEATVTTADGDGSFATRITIPSDTYCPQDQCTVLAQGKKNLKWDEATYTIS